ncbi:MAG: hypothetical protein AB7P02_06535 [Alphaproteobacteria bacterium]
MAKITLVPPARLSGSTEEQVGQISQYQQQQYAMLVASVRAMAAVAALAPLAMTVSNPPTQDEVQAIATRVDAIIAAMPEIT